MRIYGHIAQATPDTESGTLGPSRSTSAKTVGSLLDFWYHAIEHGPNALGLMVRRQRTDLKDTQLAAMNIYGNAAEWKEHGSYFQFTNGARLWFAYLEF